MHSTAAPLSLRQRPRRLRQSALLRRLVRQTRLRPSQLMMPHFVLPGAQSTQPIAAMPGIARCSIDLLLRQVEADLRLGLRQVLLFGVPPASAKDSHGSSATQVNSLIAQAVTQLRQQFGEDLLIATDVCLCAYTEHGHCGVLGAHGVDNDASLPHLAAMALAHAQAGADIVAPSDMMDARVGYLRDSLDAQGYTHTVLMAYTAKYASAYYGPFREAAASTLGKGDRRSYQMDPANRREAWREALLDAAEGADILMVKPALPYLDIIALLRAQTQLPLACYNVSGEYSLVKAAAAQGWIDEAAVVRENLLAMARAGADILITYHARAALQGHWLDTDEDG